MTKAAHEIREIAGWMTATGIGFLELRMPDATVRLGRRDGRVVALAPDDGGEANGQSARAAEGSDAPGQRVDTVAAPSLGVFLLAHPGGPAPLVRVGDRVRAGQVLGLLRIGVLLLPVCATRAGIVAALRADDGATVGYGAALVDLHPL